MTCPMHSLRKYYMQVDYTSYSSSRGVFVFFKGGQGRELDIAIDRLYIVYIRTSWISLNIIIYNIIIIITYIYTPKARAGTCMSAVSVLCLQFNNAIKICL